MEEKLKLNVKVTLLISLSLVTWGAFSEIFNSTIQNILVVKLGNSETFKGVIMSIGNVCALLLFPLFGMLSDRTTSKFGKRKPYIVVGGFLTAASMIGAMIFVNNYSASGFSPRTSTIGFSVFITLAMLGMAVNQPAAFAIIPDLTPKPLNSEANALKGIVLASGGFAVTVLIGVFGTNFTVVYSATTAVMVLSLIIFMIFVSESKMHNAQRATLDKYNRVLDSSHKDKFRISTMPKDKKRSVFFILTVTLFSFFAYGAVMSTYVNYANKVWGMEYNQTAIFVILIGVGGLIVIYPVTLAAKKIGRKNTVMIGLGFLFAGLVMAGFMEKFGVLVIVAYLLFGIGWSALNIISMPMLFELSDASTLGTFVSAYTVACTIGRTIAPFVIGVLIDNTRFGYAVLYPVAAAAVVVAAICLLFVKHGNVTHVPEEKSLPVAQAN